MTYKKEYWKLQFARGGALTIIASLIPIILGYWIIAFIMISITNVIGWWLFFVAQKELVDKEKCTNA